MLLNYGVGEDSWESLGLQGDQPVNPTGNQSWIFIGGTDAEAEAPIFWPPDAKNWLIWKDPDAGKDWRQEEKGMTEDEMVGWHHWLDGHKFALRELVMDREAWHAAAHGVPKSRTWLNNWTELNWFLPCNRVPPMDALNNRKWFPHSSGGWRSEIKVLADTWAW